MNIYTKEILKIYSHFHFNGKENSSEAISLTITSLQTLFLFQEVIFLAFIEVILLNIFQKSLFFFVAFNELLDSSSCHLYSPFFITAFTIF